MDKRTISSYHYTGQPVMVTGRNVPEFVRFPAQGQSFYPSYGYGHYGSGHPYQDIYCTNYGQQVQDGYLPFNLRSLPNPSSFSQSYNHLPDLQHSYQRTPTPRLYKEPHHENVKHTSFTPTPGNDSASCSLANFETQLAPSTEETADKRTKKKRKKKKKSSSTPNDKAEAEIPNEISVASENLFSSSNSLNAPDLEESNRTGIVPHPGKPEGATSNKWVNKPIQLYRKQNEAGTSNNYNAEFPSLDNISTSSTQSTETLMQKSRIESATPSFAEKLKKSGENVPLVRKHAEAPFLDWRDQRTNTVKTSNEKMSSPSVETETIHIKRSLLKQSYFHQNDQPPSTPHEGSEEDKPVEETTSQKDKGWVTVSKHNSRFMQSHMQTIIEPEKVKPNAVSVSPVSDNEPSNDKKPAVVLTPEARAKLKAKRKAKREQMKGEKKLLRETKIRMERLAPKDQKVRMITPQIMSNYNKPIQNPRPEDYIPDSLQDFPTLEYSSKPNGECSAPGSSSYSAALQRLTMLTKKVEEPVQACSSSVSKKLKRKDPMEFNLFDTASTKSQLKAAKQERRKNALLKNKVQKFRDAVKIVANPLDSSAPSFSRGKIRQKKKRLTYVEKAQLREKLRKQAVNKMINEKWDPSDTNLDELIALLGSKLTGQGRIKMKEELEAILALYNAQRAQLASACVPKVPAEGVKLHSRRFRDYCDQLLKDDIDDLLTHLLSELHRFQDRAYNLDPIKARSKRRLLLGLKEVTKQVVRKRVKIVILVPDIQACPGTGGLDEAVARLLDAARSQNLPIIYGLSRRKLGKLLKKKVPASCCGILNYQSMEETFRKLWELVEQARTEYEAKYQQMHEVSSNEKPNAPIERNVIEILCDNVQTVSL